MGSEKEILNKLKELEKRIEKLEGNLNDNEDEWGDDEDEEDEDDENNNNNNNSGSLLDDGNNNTQRQGVATAMLTYFASPSVFPTGALVGGEEIVQPNITQNERRTATIITTLFVLSLLLWSWEKKQRN